MKKLLVTVLAIVVLTATPLVAAATPTGIGIYQTQTPGNPDRCKTTAAFAIFEMYIMATNVGSITGWEAGVTFAPDAGWNVLSTTLNPPNAINVGSAPTNFIIGLGSIVNGGSLYRLATYSMGYFAGPTAPELTLCIGPSSPTTAEFNNGPGYATGGDLLIPLVLLQTQTENYPEGCAIINPTFPAECVEGLATTEASFGQVKARF